MQFKREFSEPKRTNLSYAEAWEGDDLGIISAWERGREKRNEDLELTQKVLQGELVELPWKGGIDKPIKSKTKYGSLLYLAMLQGIKGENLQIETEIEVVLVCSRTGTPVTFTSNLNKLGSISED
jgi:hypothetical protein